jgi:hypothetical protein
LAIKIRFTGVKGLEKALNPKHLNKLLKQNMRKATRLNGKLGEAAQRKEIQQGVPPRNAPLTQAIKGGDKPLVHTSALFASITSRIIKDTVVFVGVLRTNARYNIAVAVHEGATISVTPKMRGLFFALWQASSGAMDPNKLSPRAKELFEATQDWKPLSSSTTAIIIPPREWVKRSFERPEVQAMAKANWEMALEHTFKQVAEMAKSGP